MFPVSRLAPLTRGLVYKCRNVAKPLQIRKMESGTDYFPYRTNHYDEGFLPLAKGFMTFFWYWILMHFYYDFDRFLQPYFLDYPDPAKWTDEELGIPPDDED